MWIDINHNTTIDWNKYLREVCESKLLSSTKIICGCGLMVESLSLCREENITLAG